MTRSIESIKKRAEKRGRTLEEQLKIEAALAFKGANVALTHASPTPRHVASSEGRAALNEKAQMEAKLKGGWDCGPCNNRNFEERVECFRCRRVKPRPTLNIPAAPSLKRTDRNEDARGKDVNFDEKEGKKEKLRVDATPQDSGWGVAASSERLQSNEYLRQLCVSVEGPTTTTTISAKCSGASEELLAAWSSLSSVEQERGRLLVARSQRKKAAKATGAAKRIRAIGNRNESARRAVKRAKE